MKTVKTTPIHQQGSTLIEILVSMFILALGLMALIAMQTRTSIGIKEAENQTIIAQATENLAENMLTNPVLGLNAGTITTGGHGVTTTRDYSKYKKNADCKKLDKPEAPVANSVGAAHAKDKGSLVKYHQDLFFNQACKVSGYEGDVALNVTGTTLTVKWTMGGSSGKEFEYKYELDNMD